MGTIWILKQKQGYIKRVIHSVPVTFENNLGGKIHHGSSVTWKLLHFGISVTRHHVAILECMVNLEQCCRETYV